MKDTPDLNDLLNDRNKGIEETRGLGGILAKLWRKVLYDTSMENSRLEYHLSRYVERARHNMVDPSVAGYYNKGNLRRELAKPALTWKVFIKALRVIDVVHIEIGIKLKHRGGKITLHGVNVNISDDEEMMRDETGKSMEDDE